MWKKLSGGAVLLVLVVAGAWVGTRREIASPRVDSPNPPPPLVAAASTESTPDATSVRRAKVVTTPTDAIQPPAKPSIEVHGRVLDESTRAPVGGATVFVDLRSRWPNGSVPRNASITGADGTFVVREVPRLDSSAIYVLSPEHARERRDIVDPGVTAARRNGVAVGDIVVGRGATLHGRAIDASGLTVSQASLLLYDGQLNDSGESMTFYPFLSRAVGSTNEAGEFTVPHVATSGVLRYAIFAVSDRGQGGQEFTIPHSATETEIVEIRLSKPARLDLEIVDEDGKAMAGVQVGCGPLVTPYVENGSRVDARFLAGYQIGGPYSKATDASGLVSFPALPADSKFGVAASAEGFQIATMSGSDLDSATPTRRRLVLHRLREITISGRVVDVDGGPMANTVVERHCGYQSDASKSKEGETQSDALGNFRLEGVPGDRYCQLVVGAPGIARTPVVIDTTKYQDVEALVLVATPSAPITGIVVDDAGAPIADATVYVESDAKMIRCDAFRTDDAGRFRISNALAGPWKLKVGMLGDPQTWAESWIECDVEGGASDVRIIAVRQIAGSATVEVAVFDATSHEPLDLIGAQAVRTDRIRKPTDTFMDPPRLSKGRVELERVQPGPYRLWVKSDGHSEVTLDFVVSPTDIRVQLELPVSAPARVTVRLIADGRDDTSLASALHFATVMACGEEGVGLQEGEAVPQSVSKTNATEFYFEQIPPRRVRFRLWSSEWIGDVVLDASGGGDLSVVMPVFLAGVLHVPGDAIIATNVLSLRCVPVSRPSSSGDTQSADGDSEALFVLGYPGRTREEQSFALAPGSWRYEVRHGIVSGSWRGNLGSTTVISEGTFEIHSGGTTELVIPTAGNVK